MIKNAIITTPAVIRKMEVLTACTGQMLMQRLQDSQFPLHSGSNRGEPAAAFFSAAVLLRVFLSLFLSVFLSAAVSAPSVPIPAVSITAAEPAGTILIAWTGQVRWQRPQEVQLSSAIKKAARTLRPTAAKSKPIDHDQTVFIRLIR